MSMDKAPDLLKIFSQTLSEKNVPQDGDYIENGLVFCGKCHTAKESRMEFHGEDIVFPIWCDCMRQEYDEQQRKAEMVKRSIRAAELRHHSMIAGKYSGCTFESADTDGENSRSIKICERYAEKFPQMLKDNRGLLLFGNVGTGKTFAAACIANSLLDRNYSVVMVSLITLIDGADEIIRRIGEIDLLILDDLGAERSTDYGFERIYAVTDARYRSGKPVIYTSNLPLDMLKNCPDIRCARIYDRVLERCYPVEFRGVSRRKREARRGFEEMNKLLDIVEEAKNDTCG